LNELFTAKNHSLVYKNSFYTLWLSYTTTAISYMDKFYIEMQKKVENQGGKKHISNESIKKEYEMLYPKTVDFVSSSCLNEVEIRNSIRQECSVNIPNDVSCAISQSIPKENIIEHLK
jgi:hypothetical protein